jgi:uncharacterized protein (TIGR04222 family)
MNAKHVELLRRLEQFQLDSPEASLPFSARLARENHWPSAYAQRVIAEYKRFAFLAVAAGHPVSPSEDVDQVWHLHLAYSENYWKVFCPEVLGKPFHHQPAQGGRSESAKFDDWYARTLESYKLFFHELPPCDIWPGPEARRKEKHNFTRVDRERNWVIPKPRLRVNTAFFAWFGFASIALCCTGAMLAEGANIFDWRGPDFLAFYVALLGCCFGMAAWLRSSLRQPSARAPLDVPKLDGYATAFLNGGKILTVNTAIANLARQNAVRVDEKTNRVTSLVPKPAFEHELERLIYAAADSTDGCTIANAREAAKSGVAKIDEDLKARGLVVADGVAARAIAFPLMLALAAIAVGVIKIFVGLSRNRPVEYLFVLCIMSLVIALAAFARRPLRSRYGDAVLKAFQEHHTGSRELTTGTAGISSTEFVMVLGLFGMTALAGTEMDALRKSLQPPSGASSCGSSCGGGCGGGGCGGGCGGCGGGD